MNYQHLSYNVNEYRSKQKDYCVCIFVINEGEKLHTQLKKMSALDLKADVVIADGGSTDGSVEREFLEKYNVNTLLVKTCEGKLGTQMQMGFDWALNIRKYKGVVVIDGNNKDSVEDIPKFIEKLKENFDHIQGSRFIKGGSHSHTPISRLLGVRLIHAPLIKFFSGFPYTDTTNGFRAYSAKLLTSPKLDIFREELNGYELHYYLAVNATKKGFNSIEIPVTRNYPDSGTVPTKISPIRGNLTVLYKLFCTVLGLYDPKDK